MVLRRAPSDCFVVRLSRPMARAKENALVVPIATSESGLQYGLACQVLNVTIERSVGHAWIVLRVASAKEQAKSDSIEPVWMETVPSLGEVENCLA